MKTLVTVWFSPEGDIICETCRLDYAPVRLRPSHVQAGLVACAHCHTIIGVLGGRCFLCGADLVADVGSGTPTACPDCAIEPGGDDRPIGRVVPAARAPASRAPGEAPR